MVNCFSGEYVCIFLNAKMQKYKNTKSVDSFGKIYLHRFLGHARHNDFPRVVV